MHFQGPEPEDYDNVRALNRAFLHVISRRGNASLPAAGLPDSLAQQLKELDERQARRLARVPFLLMSFRENDAGFWQRLSVAPAINGLLPFGSDDPIVERLCAAGIGFLWQLARRNPYAARLVSGASPPWCEQLAEATLLDVVQHAFSHRAPLGLRFADEPGVWVRLLGPGIGDIAATRSATQMSVLQLLLTRSSAASYERLRSAACKSAVPVMRIADKSRDD